MKGEYKISDLFFTSWQELKTEVHAQVYTLYRTILDTKKSDEQYGFMLIKILRMLRKRPLLVDKITVSQAVDIFNDLQFLKQPWYYFPRLDGFHCPDDKMARHSFDEFIYADHEYSLYVATADPLYLRRLTATLYQHKFDKEAVEGIANGEVMKKVKQEQLLLAFYTYAMVRQFVTDRCKTLLPKPPRADSEEQPEPTPTGAMWLKLKHRLAETPAFQGYETAGKSNMYATIDYLEDLAQQKANAES
jgi:hypothetical protein